MKLFHLRPIHLYIYHLIILFGFMDKGYISLRELEDECKVNIRYMYLMEYKRQRIPKAKTLQRSVFRAPR